MTHAHITDFYMDGFVAVPFCKVCSAEGLKLLETCSGPIDTPSKKEFEEKYQKAIDQSKPKR